MSLLLATHIFFGFGSLLAAGGALLATKGGKRHRICGKLYVGGMTIVCLSGVVLAVAIQSFFLGCIALFSGYFVYSGARFVYRGDRKASALDWLVLGFFLALAAAMAGGAANLYAVGDGRWVVLSVFSLLAFQLGYSDVRHYARIRKKREASAASTQARGARRKKRIQKHLAHMLGAVIATTTAFTVVNIQTNPVWLAWLAPTALFVPLIFYWTRRIEKSW